MKVLEFLNWLFFKDGETVPDKNDKPTSPCATDQLRHQLFKDGGMAPPPRPVPDDKPVQDNPVDKTKSNKVYRIFLEDKLIGTTQFESPRHKQIFYVRSMEEAKENRKKDFYNVLMSSSLSGHEYRLITHKVVKDGMFFIEHRDNSDIVPIWIVIRTFHDIDTEYAMNCAREAFEYLTKEI